jgi:hypothetical protein
MSNTVKKKSNRRCTRETPKPRLVKPKPNLPRVTDPEVTLLQVSNTPTKGSGVGGEKWRIEVGGIRAGEVYINVIDEPPLGYHASIQIYLNIKSQGRGIGRIAYLKACLCSRHDTIYAHMRKSNIASRRAAEAAGFIDATPHGYNQLIMMRERISLQGNPGSDKV